MLDRFRQFVRGVMNRMFNRSIYTQAGITPVVTDAMMNAIEFWGDMYKNEVPWLNAPRQSLHLPSLIAAEVATMVTLEAQITITGDGRGTWLGEQMQPTIDRLQRTTEYACATGGIVFKPYPDGSDLAVDVVQARDFLPTSYDSRGNVTGAVFVERIIRENVTFLRYEMHEITDNGYRITNRAFRQYNSGTATTGSARDLSAGTEVPLTEVEEWADIEPEVNIAGVDHPLFAYFRIPLGNTIDPRSPLGVSIYAKASDLIKDADEQYQRIMWEYEGSELAIDAPEDIFTDERNKVRLPTGKERLFRMNKLDPNKQTGSKIMDVFSPEIRDTALFNGLNKVLMQIENLTGLSRGTLADVNIEARTATEIRIARQRTYATVTAIQRSLEAALDVLLQAMDTMATLYSLAPAGKYEASYVWDDSVVTDSETERVRDMTEVRDGLMHKWEYRVKWYGEDEATAKAMTGDDAEQTDDEIMGFKALKTPEKPEEKDKEEKV